MSCNCAQGYSQPAVNKSPCGCQRGYSGPRPYSLGWLAPPVVTKRPGLGRPYGMAYSLGGPPAPTFLGKLGAITQGMAPIAPGCTFSIGFQLSAIRSPWTDETTYAGILESNGYSYNTTSGRMSGVINPYVTISGYSMLYYDNADQFAFDIINLLQQNGVPIDTSVVNFQSQPFDPSTNTCGGQQVGLAPTGSPGSPGGGSAAQPACPPGYVDKSWFGGLLGYNCQPIGAGGSGLDLTSLFAGAGGAVVIGGVVLLILFLKK